MARASRVKGATRRGLAPLALFRSWKGAKAAKSAKYLSLALFTRLAEAQSALPFWPCLCSFDAAARTTAVPAIEVSK
jgi:hypothetical protein